MDHVKGKDCLVRFNCEKTGEHAFAVMKINEMDDFLENANAYFEDECHDGIFEHGGREMNKNEFFTGLSMNPITPEERATLKKVFGYEDNGITAATVGNFPIF